MFESPIMPTVAVEESLDQISEIINLSEDGGIEKQIPETASKSPLSECGKPHSPQPNNIIKYE